MKPLITCARLAGALALPLALLGGVRAVRADKPALPPPPPAYPSSPAPTAKHPGKLHLRVPFTPVNEDGSLGRRTLITITVEGEDREQALEAADQIMDRLLVQPAVDDLWDEINQRIQDAIQSGGTHEILPPPAPVPGPASRSVEAQPSSTPGEVSKPTQRVRTGVEITVEGLLQAVDGAGGALGVPSLFGHLGIPVIDLSSDPNQRMEQLRKESMEDQLVRDLLRNLEALLELHGSPLRWIGIHQWLPFEEQSTRPHPCYGSSSFVY